MSAHEIRRHPDGSLDVDFYRRRAVALRARAKRDTLRNKAVPLAKVLVAAGILAVTLYLVPSADGTGWNGKTNGSAIAGRPSATIVSGKS